MTLPVYVIHWNEPDRLLTTIAGLAESEGVEVDVCVIDNASEQAAIDTISEGLPDDIPIVRLPVNIGFAGAGNEAIARVEAARAPWFVIASYDVILRPDTLVELVACIRMDHAIGIVGPLLTNAHGIPPTTEEEWRLREISKTNCEIDGSVPFPREVVGFRMPRAHSNAVRADRRGLLVGVVRLQ